VVQTLKEPLPVTISGRRLILIIFAVAIVISTWAARSIISLRRKMGSTAGAAAQLPLERPSPSGTLRLVPYGYTLVDEDRLPMQLPAFYLNRTEVTNAAFSQFSPVPGAPDLPVVNVTYDQARAYCASVGQRLPQPQEWEKAARGEQGARWPWGETDDASRANVSQPAGSVQAAGSHAASASPYGHLDLIGNVWEWVDDPRTPMPRNLEGLASLLSPPPTRDERWFAARGGAFDTNLADALPYKYLVLPARYKAANLGFRCATQVLLQ
jgi:formylglycine-generating enzyme required for sulfatase activity